MKYYSEWKLLQSLIQIEKFIKENRYECEYKW